MDAEALKASYPWYRLRSTQYDQLYVSPHMDDAVYSCGGQIALERAAGKRILIITVFGDGADARVDGADARVGEAHGTAREQPEAHGSDEPARASTLRSHARGRASTGKGVFGDVAQRKREERAAVERLDVDHLWLNYPDLLMRPKRLGELFRYSLPFVELAPDPMQERLYAALSALCQRLLTDHGEIFFPLGVGAHPDHRIVHAVGRAFVASGERACAFYEDIPYAQVRALRDDRLRQLGLPRADAALASAREVHAFVFARASRWQRAFALPLVLGHALFMRALFGLFAEKTPRVRERDLTERAIDGVIHTKVEAMRAYVTQTAFFFPPGDAIYDVLVRAGGHYVERYWTLSRLGSARSLTGGGQLEAELTRVDTLMHELSSRGTG